MFKSRAYNGAFENQRKCFNKIPRTLGKKRQTKPLRRFDCFDPEDDNEIPTEEELFINEISQKICLLSLQVSRIENRLSAFETQPNDDLKKPFELRDPPNCPPTVPVRRKKVVKKNKQSTSVELNFTTDRFTNKK